MQCPKCGRYMSWYMYYHYGMPISGWKCICGFDTLTDYRVVVTDSTKRSSNEKVNCDCACDSGVAVVIGLCNETDKRNR